MSTPATLPSPSIILSPVQCKTFSHASLIFAKHIRTYVSYTYVKHTAHAYLIRRRNRQRDLSTLHAFHDDRERKRS